MKKVFLCLSMLLFIFSCNKTCGGNNKSKAALGEKTIKKEQEKLMKDFNLKSGDKLYAIFHTSLGDMKAELAWEKAPVTVENFVGLARGTREWLDPNTRSKREGSIYDNTIFHRIIKGFMIQGGDPTGTGFGGPGYKFKDEFHQELSHSKKGILSMANSGPNTNGSQFFITSAATPHLNRRHSIFGEINDDASLAVLDKIENVKTNAQDKPLEDVVLKNIEITTN